MLRRFCGDCGSRVDEGAPFCGDCGAAQGSRPPMDDGQPTPPAGPPPPTPATTAEKAAPEPAPAVGPPPTEEKAGPEPEPANEPESRPEPVAAAPRSRRVVRRGVARGTTWLMRSRWPALVLGLLLVGAGLSYLVAPPTVSQSVDVISPRVAVDQASGTMPGLAGMDLEAARLAVIDAGLDPSDIEVVRRGAAGAPGQVLAQDPEAGVGAQGSMYLTVSEAVPTPRLVGLDFREATQAVEELGGAVRLERVVEPSRPSGTVLASSPARGSNLTAVTVLRVSDVGQSVALDDLTEVTSSGCAATEPTTIGSVATTTGISCDVYEGEESSVEYDTQGLAKALRLKVGYASDSAPTSSRLRIYLDGDLARTVVPATGDPQEVLLDVTTVRRVRFVVTGDPGDGYSAAVVLGDALFSVLPDDAPQVTAEQP